MLCDEGYKNNITGVRWMSINEWKRILQSNFGGRATTTTREERTQGYISEGTTVRSYKGVVRVTEPMIKVAKDLDNLN